LTPDAHTLALGMAVYPLVYASGSALARRGRRTRTAVPSVRDAKRAARRETRRALKRERRKAARRR
jgi:hypothetical protein